jgi:predicted RNA methylase
MNILQRYWQKLTPYRLLVLVRFLLEPKSLRARRKAVLKHFRKVDPNTLEPEIREGLKYLKSHKYASFPFRWTQKYDYYLPKVLLDSEYRRFYVHFEGKRMYFPKRFTETQIIWAIRSIFKEQDAESPHLYLTPDFKVGPGSIVVDAGVAEGNFALSVIEKAGLLYLVECDAEWMEALKLTFSPWKEKVVYVEKMLSDADSELTVTIDSILNPFIDETYFIKMDIEGFEQKALAGMKNLVASGNRIKMDVCTYHQSSAYQQIETILKNYGFQCQVSKGFVLYSIPGDVPSFRKALIRAEKS